MNQDIQISTELSFQYQQMQPVAKPQNKTEGFDYLLVLDFEATCEQNVHLQPCSEIIEFPVRAIKLPENILLEDPFHYYIRPVYNPKLTKFCTELTGITQEKVDKGIILEEALAEFDKWLAKHNIVNFIFVTCGDWDLKTCLRTEATTKKLQYKEYFKRWINVKKMIPPPPEVKNPKNYRAKGMTEMLKIFGLKLEGKHHSGIDDTYNIARVAQELVKRGINFAPKLVAKV